MFDINEFLLDSADFLQDYELHSGTVPPAKS